MWRYCNFWFTNLYSPAALQQLRLFPLTHRQIRGGPIPMFRITHGLEFIWHYPWSPPLRIQPTKGYAAAPRSPTNRDVVSAVANSLLPFGLKSSTHPQRIPSRHSWMPTGSPRSPKHRSNQPPPINHSHRTHRLT